MNHAGDFYDARFGCEEAHGFAIMDCGQNTLLAG